MDAPFITVKQEHTHEIIIRKSRFIAQIKQITSESTAKDYVKNVKSKFYDASHNCYAYTIGTHGEVCRTSDDGEPAGTAGIPILEVLKKRNIRDVIVVVTRYFGGIKLGGGGLIKAYRQSANTVLNSCTLVEKKACYIINLTFDYPYLDKITSLLSKHGYQIQKKIFLDKITIEVITPEPTINKLEGIVKEVTRNTAHINRGPLMYVYVEIESKT